MADRSGERPEPDHIMGLGRMREDLEDEFGGKAEEWRGEEVPPPAKVNQVVESAL